MSTYDADQRSSASRRSPYSDRAAVHPAATGH